ncbi:MAG: radical SAM protein [Candidatus Helarchaeota archaeon]|nr:radical SAM protein [Candidatus Helarchaeota archaeon]
MYQIDKYVKNDQKCRECRFCTKIIHCPSPDSCIGCKSCYLGCPHEAIELKLINASDPIQIYINDEAYEVFRGITIKKALEIAGFRTSRYPENGAIFTPCETGGCQSCAVIADGKVVPSCHTPIQDRMKIQTELPENHPPRRIIDGFGPHSVGGVGTPWYLKSVIGFIEVATFVAGCNFRCRTCQNYRVTYKSQTLPIPPDNAAIQLTSFRRRYHINRMAISGGESTLNRPWLIQFFKKLKVLNPDKEARIHLDTNASILTPDYIDELVAAGMTDIGPDLKAVTLETFLKITCLTDRDLAKKYLDTAWNCVKYIADNYYPEKVFMGVGLPYNEFFYPDEEKRVEELSDWAEHLFQIDSSIQVCILDYRPEFRSLRTKLKYPTVKEMKQVKKLLESVGLKCVIAQTRIGHLGPKD